MTLSGRWPKHTYRLATEKHDLKWGPITNPEALAALEDTLKPLCGTTVDYLKLPAEMGLEIEPSQVGTIVGTLTDLLLPRIALEKGIGLTKAVSFGGTLGEREGYPDFQHKDAGYRIELKGAFRDNANVEMKKPPTPREPSARLTQKVTEKNVDADRDALLVLVYELEPRADDPSLLSPTIVNLGLFPVIECVRARDARMTSGGGRWFGDFQTPTILSAIGKKNIKAGVELDLLNYGRKKDEGRDFNEDTNFGKLKRIPYRPLQEFLRDNRCQFAAKGIYPEKWSMPKQDVELALALEVAAKNAAEAATEADI